MEGATYLSDRLFVALAKRTGLVTKEALRPVREEQQRLLADGLSISLFSLARWEGVLSAAQGDELVRLARQLIAREPAYREELIEAPPPRPLSEPDEAFEPWLSGLGRIPRREGEPADPLDALGLELLDDAAPAPEELAADLREDAPQRSLATAGHPLRRDDWGDRRGDLGDSGVLLIDSGGDWVGESASALAPLPAAPGAKPSAEPIEVEARWAPTASDDVLDLAFESTHDSLLLSPPQRSGPPASVERDERRARRERRASRSGRVEGERQGARPRRSRRPRVEPPRRGSSRRRMASASSGTFSSL